MSLVLARAPATMATTTTTKRQGLLRDVGEDEGEHELLLLLLLRQGVVGEGPGEHEVAEGAGDLRSGQWSDREFPIMLPLSVSFR